MITIKQQSSKHHSTSTAALTSLNKRSISDLNSGKIDEIESSSPPKHKSFVGSLADYFESKSVSSSSTSSINHYQHQIQHKSKQHLIDALRSRSIDDQSDIMYTQSSPASMSHAKDSNKDSVSSTGKDLTHKMTSSTISGSSSSSSGNGSHSTLNTHPSTVTPSTPSTSDVKSEHMGSNQPSVLTSLIDKGSNAMSSAAQTVSAAIPSMSTSSTKTCGSTSGMMTSMKQAAQAPQSSAFVRRHPKKVFFSLLAMSYLMGMMFSSIPLMMFGLTPTSQGLLSRMIFGNYDYFSHRSGTPESKAHYYLDHQLKQRSSYMPMGGMSGMRDYMKIGQYDQSSMMPSTISSSKGGMLSGLLSMLGMGSSHHQQQQYQPSMMHPFSGSSSYGQQQGYSGQQGGMMSSLLHPFSGSSSGQYTGDDSSSWMSTMGKAGMMAKMMPSMKPNMLSSQPQQHDQSSSYLPSILGGSSSSQYDQTSSYMPSMMHSMMGLSDQSQMQQQQPYSNRSSYLSYLNPFSYIPSMKQTAHYATMGLTESEDQELKRLINEAAQTAHHRL